jgi:hypothetical protein
MRALAPLLVARIMLPFAVTAATIQALAPTTAQPQCLHIPKTDLMGNDLLSSNTSKPLPQPCPSPAACCAMCGAHDPNAEPKGVCRAWSWNLQSKTCWMKTERGDRPRSCTDTSGVLNSSAPPLPRQPRGRQLLVAHATGSTNVATTFGTVFVHPKPLLKIGSQLESAQDPLRPWSTGGIYSAVIADQSGKRSGAGWRAYFTSGLNWTMDKQCPPGSTCETGAAGLLYAESTDGVVWHWANVGIMWPPNATNQTQSDILRLVEAGTAVFEDTNPAARAGKTDAEWSLKFVGQLSPLVARSDKVMHSGGSGEFLTSADGIHFDSQTPGLVVVDGGRTPGARWDTENNFFFDERTQRYVGVMRAPRDPRCGIWWPACLRRCHSCGAGNLTDQVGQKRVSLRRPARLSPASGSHSDRHGASLTPISDAEKWPRVSPGGRHHAELELFVQLWIHRSRGCSASYAHRAAVPATLAHHFCL